MTLGIDDRLDIPESEISDITFASAEARYALLRARRMRLVLHIAGMVLALAAALTFLLVARSARKSGGDIVATLKGEHKPPQSLGIDPVGSPDAKVQVVAVLPAGSDCHSGVAKFLSDVATAHPDEFYIVYKGLEEFSQTELSNKVGQVCAAILINDTATFTLDKDGRPTSVTLVGNEPTNYKMSDVGDALTQVYTKEYGPPTEPLYELEKKCGSCPTAGAADGGAHDQHEEPAETKEPIEITLPGKLPNIKGIE